MAKLLYYSSLCFVLVIFLCDLSNHTLYPPLLPPHDNTDNEISDPSVCKVSLRKLTTGAEN